MKWFFWAFGPILLLGLNSCLTQPTLIPPTPTETISPSETPTPTIVWFPPTATITPLPRSTLAPASPANILPDFGELIFQDIFDQPDLWQTGEMTAGSVAFGINELSLGVSQPEGYLVSLRRDTSLSDFYLEVTANPSICRGEDEYGILFRVTPASDFFRFGANCAGEARLDRFLSGSASAPQPPTLSGVIPPGAPSSTRIGIWAAGREIRFYANGEFLFMVRDPSLTVGGLGLYARASGQNAVSVNFSNLSVYQVSP